jgi:hypothetical protein
MRTIAELNMLLRARTELPDGLNLATEEFREGWNFVRTVNARRLEKKIRTRGWNFIGTGDESLRSGVGDTSQEAIASALKLALRRISANFNAAEVEHRADAISMVLSGQGQSLSVPNSARRRAAGAQRFPVCAHLFPAEALATPCGRSVPVF